MKGQFAGQKVQELIIDSVGHRGDGLASGVFVPFTVPGDKVRASVFGERGQLVEVLEPGPARVNPVCKHFGTCGGCALQHMEAGAYHLWKRDLVVSALRSRGFTDPPVGDIVQVPPGSRRRAAIGAILDRNGLRLGFRERMSHRIVTVNECPVARPEIAKAIGELRTLVRAGLAPEGEAQVHITYTDVGLDVAVWPNSEQPLDVWQREPLAQEAAAMDLGRLSWAGEVVVEHRPPTVLFSGVPVALPPGAFIQATEEAEVAISRIIRESIQASRKVADLFAGCGTFTFAMAREARVHAVEGHEAALEALSGGVRDVPGLKEVTTERRDLMRRPLSPEELAPFDTVVLDPPHSGARSQAQSLAQSDVPTVVMVSCNPATFARDARIMVEGGYQLEAVTPVDQFLWSAEVELAGVLRRS